MSKRVGNGVPGKLAVLKKLTKQCSLKRVVDSKDQQSACRIVCTTCVDPSYAQLNILDGMHMMYELSMYFTNRTVEMELMLRRC